MDRRKTDRRRNADSSMEIPDLTQILDVLYRHIFLLLIIVFIPTALGFLYLRQLPDQFVAKAAILLEEQNLNMDDFQDILTGMKFDDLTLPTQIEVISSPTLVRETIATLNLRAADLMAPPMPILLFSDDGKETEKDKRKNDYNVLKIFLENLRVSQLGTSRVIEISYNSYSAEDAAKIANTHAKHYVFSKIRAKKEQAEKINLWVSEQIVLLKDESIKKSRAVQKFKSDNGMIQGLNSEDLIYQQISDIARQLSPIETRELDLRARVTLLQQGKANAITEVIESQLIQSLKSRASQTAQSLQSVRSRFGDNHPEVVSGTKELSQIRGDIAREISNIRRSIENELETITRQKGLLKEKLDDLQTRADSLQEKQITLQSLQLEESASRKLLDNFLERSEEIKSQIDFTRPDVRIISMADVPGEPRGSKKAIILMGIIFMSGIFALGIVFLLEIRDDGIQRKEDVKRILNIKLLGTLPKERLPLTRVLDKTRALYAEEIKRIYIHLFTIEKAQTVLFTSARVGEGKSLTATALAYYLHSIGKKTLLIDANTLTPNIAMFSSIESAPGFYELLSGTHELHDVVAMNDLGVSVLPAGSDNNLSSDLLLAGAFNTALEELKTIYDCIIIDSACALNTSDAELLSAMVDETVIVAAWGKTKKKTIAKACEVIRQSTKNTPHIILNHVPKSELENK